MWTKEVVDMILKGIQETVYMTLLSTLMGYVIGLPMGVLLAVSDKDGLKPNRCSTASWTSSPTSYEAFRF